MFINKPLCFRVLVERHSICGWLWALLTLYPETLQLIAFLSLAQALFFVSILSRVWFTYLQRNYVNVCCFLFFVDVSLAPPPPRRVTAHWELQCVVSLHFTSRGMSLRKQTRAKAPPSPYNGGRGFGVVCGRVCVLWYVKLVECVCRIKPPNPELVTAPSMASPEPLDRRIPPVAPMD